MKCSYKPLVRQLGAVFRDSRSLNFSFLVRAIPHKHSSFLPTTIHTGQFAKARFVTRLPFSGSSVGPTDVGALRDAYQKLLQASQEAPEITNALDNAIEGLACNLQYSQGAEQARPEWINQFVIILEVSQ